MDSRNDLEYIKQCLQGDRNAFAALVDRYKDYVFTLSLRMLKNKEDAEEVSQDVFVKVFRSMDKFKGESKFSTWIYRITYNTCLDEIKKTKPYQKELDLESLTEMQLDSMESALDNLEKEELRESINACLKNLEAEDAQILTMYYFQELSIAEISSIMSISTSNTKVKLFRSRKKLAALLSNKLCPELMNCYGK